MFLVIQDLKSSEFMLKKIIKPTPDIGSKTFIPMSWAPILIGYVVFR